MLGMCQVITSMKWKSNSYKSQNLDSFAMHSGVSGVKSERPGVEFECQESIARGNRNREAPRAPRAAKGPKRLQEAPRGSEAQSGNICYIYIYTEGVIVEVRLALALCV